jgi:hypothetical protein
MLPQVDEQWMNVTSVCHALYAKAKARVRKDSPFESIRPCFANATDLRNKLTGCLLIILLYYLLYYYIIIILLFIILLYLLITAAPHCTECFDVCPQVGERWTNVTSVCHAPYTKAKARVKKDSPFESIWPCFANATDLRNTLTGYYDNPTAAPHCIDRMGPQRKQLQRTARKWAEAAEQAAARGDRKLSEGDKRAIEGAMNAFNFTDDNGAGPYRGRLANVYWCVSLWSLLCLKLLRGLCCEVVSIMSSYAWAGIT